MCRVSTILVVDQEPVVLMAMVQLLQDEGFEVTSASSSAAALAQIRADRPRLVLWNAALPDSSESDVLRAIRADAALNCVMVVLLSAEKVGVERRAVALDDGAEDWLIRPIADIELLARIRSYLRKGELIAQLRASEHQFSSSFAHAAIGMALVAPDGRYLKINHTLRQMLGYTDTELLTRTFHDITHPDDLDDGGKVQQLLAGAIPSFQMEKRYRHQQGHWVHGLLNVSLVRDDAGHPIHQIAQIQDITTYKLALDELRESEQALRRIAEELSAERGRLVAAQAVAMVGSWETNVTTSSVRWSDQTHRIFETDPSTFQPTHPAFMQLVHPEDRLDVDQAFVESLAVRTPCAIVHRVLMPDGRVKVVEERWQTFFSEQGEPVRAVGTCQDITEAQQVQHRLRMSEARYRTLFEYAPHGITVSDTSGRYVDVNSSTCQMLGFSRDELLALNSTDIVLPQEPAAAPVFGPNAARSDLRQERKLRRKDGSTFAAEFLATPMPDGNLLGIIRDITGRKESEQEILRWARLYAALSHVNQAVATSRTREELFTKVCRALVGSGGFQLAWIGWLDPETLRVVPISYSGDGGSYLSTREFFADDRAEVCGPLSTAIREGRYSVSNDFSNDSQLGPWREQALAVGLRAGAAFPIREDGKVCGAMAVYSGEAGFFRDKEIELLNEAVGDVCFGIDSLNREIARRHAEDKLRAAERQLHLLIGRLHTAREDEAKRIARELHDDLGAKLTVLNMELSHLEARLTGATSTQLSQIERMRNVVDHTVEVVQKISGELRLGQLDVLGLNAAIEWHLQEFARQSGIACTVARLDPAGDLSDVQRTTFFRILQEALTNVVRHAAATEVVVGLEKHPGELSLSISDNGRGITAAELGDQNAIGLLGMRERVALVGGGVTITRGDKGGTTVLVNIPIHEGTSSLP